MAAARERERNWLCCLPTADCRYSHIKNKGTPIYSILYTSREIHVAHPIFVIVVSLIEFRKKYNIKLNSLSQNGIANQHK